MNIGDKLTVARNVVTSKAGRQILKAQKHSPALLFGAGVVGVVATTVVACRATLKLEEVVQENESKVDLARTYLETKSMDYGPRDYARDTAKLRTRLIVDVTRLYAPAVLLGVGSVCALGGSHYILTKRNAGLTAAYVALDRSFGEYRERVREAYGDEVDRNMLHGVEEREIAVDDAKGRTSVETVKNSKGRSPYARLFCKETSDSWSPQPDYNIVTLRSHQNWLNNQLQLKGHVLLNDVFDALGMERTKAGCVVGWVKGHGDDYIDFGIWSDKNSDALLDFAMGREGAIWLDFNVDGVVYNLI